MSLKGMSQQEVVNIMRGLTGQVTLLLKRSKSVRTGIEVKIVSVLPFLFFFHMYVYSFLPFPYRIVLNSFSIILTLVGTGRRARAGTGAPSADQDHAYSRDTSHYTPR